MYEKTMNQLKVSLKKQPKEKQTVPSSWNRSFGLINCLQ